MNFPYDARARRSTSLIFMPKTTAGGTVLNALGGEPVPYLVALAMAAEKERRGGS